MKKRIIIELDNNVADKAWKKYSQKVIPVGEFGNGRLIEIYTPVTILPKEIQKIRDAIRELEKKGITNDLIRAYILRKYNLQGSAYDMVVKGLSDIINSMETERKINKLKE